VKKKYRGKPEKIYPHEEKDEKKRRSQKSIRERKKGIESTLTRRKSKGSRFWSFQFVQVKYNPQGGPFLKGGKGLNLERED